MARTEEIAYAKKQATRGAVLILLLLTLKSSFYVVPPSDFANVRRFGTVLYTTPVGPGFHFKLPFVDTVDQL